MRFYQPLTLSDVFHEVERHADRALLAGGGTSVVLKLVQGRDLPDALVSLERVDDPGFRTIEAREDALVIGAGVSLQSIVTSPVVARHLPALGIACHVVGNLRVRHAATLAGSLLEGQVAADPPTLLTALDAEGVLARSDGERTVPIARLVNAAIGGGASEVRQGEVLTRIVIPLGTGSAHYLRVSRRSAADRPIVSVGTRLVSTSPGAYHVSAAVGSTGPFITTARGAFSTRELDLADGAWTAQVADDPLAALDPMTDHRASGWYRATVARNLLAESLKTCLENLDGRHES